MAFAKTGRIQQKISPWQLEEIKNCRTDPVYFIKQYLKIQHPKRGRIPFNLYPFQEDVIRAIKERRFTIVLKSRQLGLSTVTSAYALWLALFYRDKRILVMANKLETSRELVGKIRIAFRDMAESSPWILNALNVTEPDANSKTELELTNGSKIIATATSEDAGRGQAVSLLLIDEAAAIDELETIYESIYSTANEGGSIVIFSTPKGVGGFYHKLWVDAEENAAKPNPDPNKYYPIKLPWTVHPEHDQKWYETTTANMTQRQIQQEMECSFLGSGTTFLRPEVLEFLDKTVEEPIGCFGDENELWVWNHPQPNMEYVISADVATGVGEDYSAFHVINRTTNEVDAEYMGKIGMDDYAILLTELGYKYNTALIVQEKNSIGVATAMKLKEFNYPKLYWHKMDEDMYEYMTEEEKHLKLPGFVTTPKNRDEILSVMEIVVRTKKIKLRSSRLVAQLKTFNFTNNKAKAAKGKSDDLVMSLAIGCYIVKPNGESKETANQSKHKSMMMMLGAFQAANVSQWRQQPDSNPMQGSNLFSNPSPPASIRGVMPVYVPQTNLQQQEGVVVFREATKEQRAREMTEEQLIRTMWAGMFRGF